MTVWDKIVEAKLAAAKRYPKLWDGTSDQDIQNILTFYGLHGGLFYHIQDDEVQAVMTAHPGCKLPDWEWDSLTNDWTIFTLWASNRNAFEQLVSRSMQDKKPDLLYAVRNGIVREVTTEKLVRLFYGRIS